VLCGSGVVHSMLGGRRVVSGVLHGSRIFCVMLGDSGICFVAEKLLIVGLVAMELF
jgi:hypothetical protein